jgi:hypothetical protein
MTCDVIQNRLLALPDPGRPTADLRAHLADCAACRAVQAEAVRIERLVAAMPVPPADDRRTAFVDSLLADGPIIRSVPIIPSTRTGSGAFRPVTKFLRRIDLRWAGGVAAAVVVVTGGVWLTTRPPAVKADVAEKPRHQLLDRTSKHVVALSAAVTPPDRLAVFADWSADLRAEAGGVYKVAPEEDMNSLAGQYEKVVARGVVEQARKLDDRPIDAGDRQKLLRRTIATLADTATEAEKLALTAPAGARPALKRIADAAKNGRTSLTRIAEGREDT